jgi:hypothetical protein
MHPSFRPSDMILSIRLMLQTDPVPHFSWLERVDAPVILYMMKL